MNTLPYTKAHDQFRDRLKAFCASEVVPYIDQWEKDHCVPKAVWQKMGRAGFLSTAIAPEYGGMGGDFLYSVIALEALARTNHYGLDAFLHSDIVVPYINTYGSAAQKRQYLPGCVSGDIVTAVAMTEPDCGSDLAAMTTTAVEAGDALVLNGTKTFISNGLVCDLVVLAARDPKVQNPYQAISLYLVEAGTKGFTKGTPLNKLGVQSQDTNELFFSNCRIPISQRLGEKGRGFVCLMEKLQQERLLVALLAQVRGEFALDWTIDQLRKTGGSSQSARFAMVEMATDLALMKTFLEQLILDHMQGKNRVTQTSMAKYRSTETANRVAGRCLDLVGPAGMLESCPIVRTFRDMRVTPIFAGTNEIMKEIIAKQMGLPGDGRGK